MRGRQPGAEAPALRIGVNLMHDATLETSLGWWQAIDRAGANVIAIPDSPALLRELYVAGTLCLGATSRAMVITGVTNPVTRDPSVTAAAILSLHELAPGRVGLGIGIGDSAAWGVGLRPTTTARLREYIVAVQGLLQGDEVAYGGRRLRLRWSRWDPVSVRVPILVACAGPKVTRMAAQVADGIIASMGCGDENVAYVRQLVAEGAAAVGRDPAEVEIWWNSELVFAASPEDAMRRSLGTSVVWLTMGSVEDKQIPDELKDAVIRFCADVHDLGATYRDADRGEALVKRARQLGLYDWLVSRAPGLWGTPEQIAARFGQLAGLGMDRWLLFVGRAGVDISEHLDQLCDQVLPRLRLAG
jgi:5,10-methylenetetrahydromethanopterin reductase